MVPTETRPMAAALSMIAAMAVIGLIDNLIARIAAEVGLWQFLIVRAVIAVPLIAGAGWLAGARLLPGRMGAVVLRSLWVTLAMFLYFGSLAVMPIQAALAGLFTSPVFVVLLTVFLHGERVGRWRIFAVALGFAGVLIVLRPGADGGGPMELLAALAGLFYALGALATRRTCAGEPVLALLLGVLLCQAAVSTGVLAVQGVTGARGDGFLARGWTWAMGGALGLILVQAVGSAIGVGLIIRAYQLGETTHVSIYEYSVFLFGPVFAWILFGQRVTPAEVAGLVLIAAAGVVITVRSGS